MHPIGFIFGSSRTTLAICLVAFFGGLAGSHAAESIDRTPFKVLTSGRPTTCSLEAIWDHICISDEPSPFNKSAPCLKKGEAPVVEKEIQAALGIAPDWFRQRLCENIDLIFVTKFSKPFPSESLNHTEYEPPAVMTIIRLNRELFEKAWRLGGIGTGALRQALNFKDLNNGETLPADYGAQAADTEAPSIAGAGVLYGLAHEMAHTFQWPRTIRDSTTDQIILDLEPQLTEVRKNIFEELAPGPVWDTPAGQWLRLPYYQGQFGFIDWLDINGNPVTSTVKGTIRPENVALRAFYPPSVEPSAKPGGRSLTDLDDFAHRLYKESSFVSPLALLSPNEDYTETFAYYTLAQVVPHWKFHFLNGKSVDLMERMRRPTNPRLKQKIEFIEKRIVPGLNQP